ncbi:MAG TPA: NYN domain-containing protein [Candidatus Acidoferrales bacterium]|nr:NYN domain-containing protein [Candidatus Acidoferrales bacterium]
MAGERTNVYVDGFNLYYRLLKDNPARKWTNLVELFRLVLPSNDIRRVRYFIALVNAWPEDPGQPVRQQTYLRALDTLDEVSIHYGNFRPRTKRLRLANPRPKGPKTALVTYSEEKGSDVNLGSWLLLDAARNDFDVAVVVSDDSDLLTPVRMVTTDLHKKVGILNPQQKGACQLREAATFVRRLRAGPLAGCQFPDEMTDVNGTFHRPPSWA